jgi:predicted O-linked N-acetylglucosamine transferase (SPINDLY family)
MLTISQTLQLAMQHHQAGQFTQAEALYRQVLQREPNNSDAYHLLGVIAHHFKNYPVAVQLIQTAIRLNQTVPDFYSNLGTVLTEQGQLEEAILAFQRALALAPKDANIYYKLGNAFYQQGHSDQAISCYQQALRLNPQLATVHNNLGNVFHETGHFEEAIACFRQAVRLKPDLVGAYKNLGMTLHQQGNLEEAMACLQQALTVHPNDADSYHYLGNLLKERGKLEEAMTCYQRAVVLNPNNADIHNSLGMALNAQDKVTEAIVCYQRAITLNPNFAAVYYNLGQVLRKLERFTEALNCYQRAVALDPNLAEAYNNLGFTLMELGRIAEAVASFKKGLEINPALPMAPSNILLSLNYSTDYDPATIFLEHQQFNEQQAKPFQPAVLPVIASSRVQQDRRLKIGYVSQDFRKHSVAYFLEPILAHHAPQQVEVYCYFNNFTPPDEVTQRLQQYAHHWLNCFELSDDELAAQIRQDEIDILIDLMGHTGHNRLLVFARKPAPVQVSYLGYSNTTGLTTMDYRLTDNYTDPEGIAEQFSSEILVRMPGSYFCYLPADETDSSSVSPLPALHQGYLTFGSFNYFQKLSPQIITLWAKVLKAVPNSKLLVKTKVLNDPVVRQLLAERLVQLGISAERLVLIGYAATMSDHLGTYQQVDIALDSYPYNGATTTCEALWMGVPVVTLVGQTHVSRMGLSILSTLGLTELIAHTEAEYLQLCLKLANDLTYLQELRQTMRERLRTSPLMDASSFTRHLETIYRQLWTTWCANFKSQPEQSIQLALKHHQAGELPQVEAICQQLLQIEPNHSGALHLLGLINCQTHHYEASIKLFRQAIAVNPSEPHIYSNLGIILSKLGKISEAMGCFQRALVIAPDDEISYNNLGMEFYHQGKIGEAIVQFQKALALQPNYAMAHSNLVMALHYTTDYDPATIFLEHQQFNEQQAKSFQSQTEVIPRPRNHRRLKIGYLSPDFRKHSVAYFIEPILAHHDHQHFEIYCYFNNFTSPDAVTHRLQNYAEHWLNCFELSDDELAAKIRQDEIDILVDLMGHTNKNRILVLARKPAPVQVTYLGYSSTTGLTAIDYRLTDNYVDPEGLAEQFSSETLLRMPNSYFCYNGPGDDTYHAPISRLPALHQGYVTFGAFNNYAKLSPLILSLWAQILHKIPHSKLLVKARSLDDAATRQLLAERFAQLGISSERLILTGYALAMTDHLGMYSQVDLALDSFPYNGATTTCESLWMGVPVVTLVGETHVSRMGLSILSVLGLTALIAQTGEGYINIGVNLASDLSYLQTLRETMRARMQSSSLMAAASFTRRLEAIYREIWERNQQFPLGIKKVV